MITSAPRPPLRRPTDGRIVAGVGEGLAIHLQRGVRWVRIWLVLASFMWGAGLFIYCFLWATVPTGDPYAGRERPAGLQRLAAGPDGVVRRSALPWVIAAVGALAAATAVGAAVLFTSVDVRAWLSLIALGVGVTLLWTEMDEPVHRSATLARLAVGVLLALTGLVFWVWGGNPSLEELRALALALAIVAGMVAICSPWILKFVRSFAQEGSQRARAAEHAAIAAHLHDSVLQSLALIRARADSPEEVARIARRQERELREWLYVDRNAPGTSVASELKTVVAQIEDDYATAIDPVIVGDALPSTISAELVAAAAEALKNAVRHGKPPVTMFVEFASGDSHPVADVYIRDHGDGFDVNEIAADRFGVRESILGRITRAGGAATIDVRPGRGTEVHIHLPLGSAASSAHV